MQVQLPTRPTEMVGSLKQSSFTMDDSAVALWVSAAQYSDQPWAIVREYTTNMVDAYVLLRRQRPGATIIPPVITLPDHAIPEIVFSDFGVGMDFDTVWNTFRVYYKTLKASDKKLIGGFGLGCKVANAYADQWTVEARFDGTKRTFSAYRREDGTQGFDMVHEGPTDEPNGVTVRIPVKTAHLSEFPERVARLLPHLPIEVQVKHHDGRDAELPEKEFEYIGRGWKMAPRSAYSESYAVVGGVPYPLDQSQLPTSLRTTLREFVGYSSSPGMYIEVPVEDVDVVPSREALMYTERTLTGLEKAFQRVSTVLEEDVRRHIRKAPYFLEALHLRTQASSRFGFSRDFKGFRWRGLPIDDVFVSAPELACDKGMAVFELRESRRSVRPKLERRDANTRLDWHLYDEDSRYLFLDDLSGEKAEAKRLRVTDWARKTGNVRSTACYYFEGVSERTMERLERTLVGVTVVRISTLPVVKAPPRPKSTASGVRRVQSYQLSERCVEIPEDGGYFILSDHPKADSACAEVTNARKAGFILGDDEVYLVNKAKKSITRRPGWIDFFAHIDSQVTPARVKQAWKRLRAQQRAHRLHTHPAVKVLLSVGDAAIKRLRAAEPDAVVLRLYDEARKAAHIGAATDADRLLLSRANGEAPPEDDTKALLEQAEAAYPKLAYLSNHISGFDWILRDDPQGRDLLAEMVSHSLLK